jgi:conjugal transfer/entry exclusion protein
MRRTAMRCGGLVSLLLLIWCTPVHAQGIPVFDAANLAQNVIQALQTILMVGNQLLELTGLDDITLGDDYQADLEALGTIVKEAQGLSYDVGSLNTQITGLFDLHTAPNGSAALRERLAAIRQVTYESYVYALRTQTLLKTTLSTVQHLTRLIGAIGDLVGNKQGHQTAAQLDGTLSKALSNLQVQTAAYERAQSVERLERVLTEESIDQIHKAIMEDYPN